MGISDFLTQTATIAPVTGHDGAGMATIGAAVTVDCKFTRVVEMTSSKTSTGRRGVSIEEEGPDAVMFVRSTITADPEDQVVFSAVNYEITEVIHRLGTATQLKHKKLLLKKFS